MMECGLFLSLKVFYYTALTLLSMAGMIKWREMRKCPREKVRRSAWAFDIWTDYY